MDISVMGLVTHDWHDVGDVGHLQRVLVREFADTHDPEIPEEIYKLARRL